MAQSALARARVEDEYAGRDTADQLVSTPATERPSGAAERNLQSLMKARRVAFVVGIMVNGDWNPALQEKLAGQWWPKRDAKHQREKMKEISSLAFGQVAPQFDRREVGARISQRMEQIQVRAMAEGRDMMAIRAADLQAKVSGIGKGEYPEGFQGQESPSVAVQVINVQGQEVGARTDAMGALFRGRTATKLTSAYGETKAAEPAKAEDQNSGLGPEQVEGTK